MYTLVPYSMNSLFGKFPCELFGVFWGPVETIWAGVWGGHREEDEGKQKEKEMSIRDYNSIEDSRNRF